MEYWDGILTLGGNTGWDYWEGVLGKILGGNTGREILGGFTKKKYWEGILGKNTWRDY